MDKSLYRLYIRQHSTITRKHRSYKSSTASLAARGGSGSVGTAYNELFYEEDPHWEVEETRRIIVVILCRMRQRLLRQSFRRLIANTEVEHDYESDARIILSRKLLDDEIRTELEIEVLFNWIDSIKNVDPTSIANTILMCKKRTFIFNALQQLRLEFYGAGETVLFQGDMPRPEDGHFTIVDGSCEVVQFPEDSTPLQKTLYMSKQRQWDDCKKLLLGGVVVANIHKFSGFGELSTLTGVKRAATIRADRTPGVVTEIAVLPKQALLDCLKFRRVGEVVEGQLEGLAPSEAMDFMRQSGLANRISPKDLVRAAHCMIRHTLMQGDVLFYKGQYVNSIFLVVSGEFLLDTRDCFVEGSRDPQPFLDSYPEVCYYLSGGSVLGDEGVTGRDRLFLSTAACISESAVVFEAVGFGLDFLSEKFGSLKYCALSYKKKSRWGAPVPLAEETNPYTYFRSLRQEISLSNPFRGSQTKDIPPDMESRPSSSSSSSGGSLNYPKTLRTSCLHRALEINKVSKKMAFKNFKVHAQETILYDEMVKELAKSRLSREQQQAEESFKHHIDQYRQRTALILEQKRLDDEARAQKIKSTAVNFFGGWGNSSDEEDDSIKPGAVQGPTEQGDIHQAAQDDDSSVDSTSILVRESIQSRAPPMASLLDAADGKRLIEKYFTWIDSLNRHSFRNLFKAEAPFDVSSLNRHDNSMSVASYDDNFYKNSSSEKLCLLFYKLGLTTADITCASRFLKNSAERSNEQSSSTVPALQLPPTGTYDQNIAQLSSLSLGGGSLPVVVKPKTYTPSSWREDVKKEKMKNINVEKANAFLRASTPDNRRILSDAYSFPGCFCPEKSPDRSNTTSTRAHEFILANNITTTSSAASSVEQHLIRRRRLCFKEKTPVDIKVGDDPLGFMSALESLQFPKRKQHMLSHEWSTRYVVRSHNHAANDTTYQKPNDEKEQEKDEGEAKRSAVAPKKKERVKRRNNPRVLDLSQKKIRPVLSSDEYVQKLSSYTKATMLEAAKTIQQSNLLVYAAADISTAASSSSTVASKHASSTNSPSRDHSTIPTAVLRDDHIPIASDRRRVQLLAPQESLSKPSSRKNSAISLLSNPADEEPSHFVDMSASLDPYLVADSMDAADDKSLSSTSSTVVSQTAMIDQMIRLSATEFNAPEPSHIEISMLNKDTIDAELQSVLFDIPLVDAIVSSSSSFGQDNNNMMMVSDQPVAVDSLVPPTYSPSTTQNTSPPPPTDSTPNPVKRKAHEKTLAAQQRLEDLKKKLLAEAPSDAVMAYNKLSKGGNRSRKFYEGKRRALARSTFALMNDPDYDEEVLYAQENKSREADEAALFKSMFPDCSADELKEFRMHIHENNRFPRLSSREGGGEGAANTTGSLSEASPPRIESRRAKDLHAVMDWQQYTVTKLLQNKTGPKKTLPVVVVKYEGGCSSKRFAINKAKRWGGGALVPLAAEDSGQQILGPPSYLELFTKSSKVHLTEQEKQRIKEDLKNNL